jgi:hypothetical protein
MDEGEPNEPVFASRLLARDLELFDLGRWRDS